MESRGKEKEEIGTRIHKLRYIFVQNCGMDFLSAKTMREKTDDCL